MKRTTTPQLGRRDYPCWALVQPAPDMKGKWVAHCLDFDTLAQADDPRTAVELLLASTNDIVLEDLRAGSDPLCRRAPDDDEDWSLLRFVLRNPDQLRRPEPAIWDELREKAKNQDVLVVVQFFLGFQRSVASPHLASESVQPTFFQTREREQLIACM